MNKLCNEKYVFSLTDILLRKTLIHLTQYSRINQIFQTILQYLEITAACVQTSLEPIMQSITGLFSKTHRLDILCSDKSCHLTYQYLHVGSTHQKKVLVPSS